MSRDDSLPDDAAALKAMLIAERGARAAAEARTQTLALEIEKLKFAIAKLRHERYGQSSESHVVLEQLELELAELQETASQGEVHAQMIADAAKEAKVTVVTFERRRPARRPLPAHLPRERVVEPAPAACPCCGGTKLRKIGEDVTETLEVIPRQWKVISHVREKFSCRACEKIAQAPAPSHPIARGRAGPQLLAQVLFAKYALHLPLNRQSNAYADEGIDLDVSTLADWVGACAATLMPIMDAIKGHVFAAERIHADDTTVKVQAKHKCRTARLWTYVRDDRPFGGHAPPAAVFFYSRDRAGQHPQEHLATWAGFMQADAYGGFNRLYDAKRKPAPIVEVACWAHARRKFFDLARIQKSPLAIEAINRIDALFAIEAEINGQSQAQRLAVRSQRARPLLNQLEVWLRENYRKLSSKSQAAEAIAYTLNRVEQLTRFLGDGRLCMTNNAAERELRAIAVGRNNWTFCGSDEGGRRAAAIYTLINTAKLNDVDPLAWLADILRRLPDHPMRRIHELLPWNWKVARLQVAA
jgi:transposase